jgi:phage head maturation protease
VSVKIEPGGRFLRGVAVPFGASAIVKMRDKVVEEIFDPDSFERPPPGGVPLLVNHVRDREPTGVVHSTAVRSYGLGFEAELLVSDADAEVWERRFKAGLVSGVSVGYLSDHRRFVWERPTRRGGLPVVRPRGVGLEHLSLILLPTLPAYNGAKVLTLSQRTAADQRGHEESERIIHEWERERIEREHRRRMRARGQTVAGEPRERPVDGRTARPR